MIDHVCRYSKRKHLKRNIKLLLFSRIRHFKSNLTLFCQFFHFQSEGPLPPWLSNSRYFLYICFKDGSLSFLYIYIYSANTTIIL